MKHTIYTLVCSGILLSGCNNTSFNHEEGVSETTDTSVAETTEPTVTQTETPFVKKGWYLRTTVTAVQPDGTTLSHKTAGVFGELSESDAGKDKHDIPSYGAASLQVRFINEHLSREDEYFSDYRHYDGNEKKESWTFVVKNEYTTPPINLANASLKIDVEPMREVFQKEGNFQYIEKVAEADQDKRTQLALIDLDNQRVYRYDEWPTLDLSMDGKHTRTFRWVLGTPDQSDMTMPSGAKTALNIDVFSVRKTVRTSKFGMPPE